MLEDLLCSTDAVFANLRGDQPEKLRLTYRDLRHLNPRIVCCSLSGFGMTGPRTGEGGYDYMMQGIAGWMALTGEPDGPPIKSGLSLVDLSGGYVAAIALMAGLWRARREGVGCDCDVSLFETALHELVYVGTWAATHGYVPARHSNSAHPSIVPFQNFETLDGWIVVACPKEKFWKALCEALALPEVASDPRFGDFAARDANRAELVAILDEAFATRSSAEWLTVLAEHGVPSAPVNDVADALRDRQAEARGVVVEYDHPRLGTVRTIRTPLRVGDESDPRGRAPFRGEHTVEVLRQLCGYSDEFLEELAASGTFGANHSPRSTPRTARRSASSSCGPTGWRSRPS